jgi:RNA polymerase-binding protein DksA
MRKRELERFEKLLLERRDEILREMGLTKARTMDNTTKDATGDHSSYSFHMADLATDAMEREKAFMLNSKAGRFLYHLDEALRRIKDGTFGKCVSCNRNISVQRLRALPHARYCIACKEREEQEKNQKVQRK